MEQLWQTSHLQGGNLAYVEQLFETYLTDPNAVPEEWRSYFDKLPSVDGYQGRDIAHSSIREQFEHISRNQRFLASGVPASVTSDADKKQIRVLQLINAYRFRGHQEAKLDPLGVWQRPQVEDLDPSFHELSSSDYDLEFQTGSLNFGSETSFRAFVRPIAKASALNTCTWWIPASSAGSSSAWSPCVRAPSTSLPPASTSLSD
jgi:2-oxoglutarate dehydrogenase E1 component